MMTTIEQTDTGPRLAPDDARRLLRDLAAWFDRRADDITNNADDRIRWAEISSAIGWALKAEVGTVVLDPVKAQVLDDYRAVLRHQASGVRHDDRRTDLVLDRIAAVDHALAQVKP